MKRIQLKSSILRGIIILLPATIFLYLAWTILGKADQVGRSTIQLFLANSDYQKFLYPGAGLLLILLVCYSFGRLSLKENGVFAKILRKIPIINIFWSKNGGGHSITIKEVLNWTPCQFWKTSTIKSEGFIVGFQKINGKTEEDVIVYYANPPFLITGEICNVPKCFVFKLANPAKEIINKLILFGKMKPDELIPVPWDGETEKEFRARVNSTPPEIELQKFFNKKTA